MYLNNHGENTKASLTRQKKCTTSTYTEKEIKGLFECLPSLDDHIINLQEDNFEMIENCAYQYTLECIDILQQISTYVLGGKEYLFRIHQDQTSKKQRDDVVSIIFLLTKVK